MRGKEGIIFKMLKNYSTVYTTQYIILNLRRFQFEISGKLHFSTDFGSEFNVKLSFYTITIKS